MMKKDRVKVYFQELHKVMCLEEETRDLAREIESEFGIDEKVTKIVLKEWRKGDYIEKQMARLQKAKEILDAVEIVR